MSDEQFSVLINHLRAMITLQILQIGTGLPIRYWKKSRTFYFEVSDAWHVMFFLDGRWSQCEAPPNFPGSLGVICYECALDSIGLCGICKYGYSRCTSVYTLVLQASRKELPALITTKLIGGRLT